MKIENEKSQYYTGLPDVITNVSKPLGNVVTARDEQFDTPVVNFKFATVHDGVNGDTLGVYPVQPAKQSAVVDGHLPLKLFKKYSKFYTEKEIDERLNHQGMLFFPEGF